MKLPLVLIQVAACPQVVEIAHSSMSTLLFYMIKSSALGYYSLPLQVKPSPENPGMQ